MTNRLHLNDDLRDHDDIRDEVSNRGTVDIQHRDRLLLLYHHSEFSEAMHKCVLVDLFGKAVTKMHMDRESCLSHEIAHLPDRFVTCLHRPISAVPSGLSCSYFCAFCAFLWPF